VRYASKGTNGQLFAARFLHAPDREPALEFIETSPRPAQGAPILLIHGAFSAHGCGRSASYPTSVRKADMWLPSVFVDMARATGATPPDQRG
jgi:hypothetical protein